MTARTISTAYGRAALEALRAVVGEAKREDPLAPVTIIVPNNIAGVVARRFPAHGLHDGGPAAVAALYVTTLPRLAEQLAAPTLTGQGRRPATQPIIAAAWRRVLTDEPGLFAAVAEHPATIRALVAAHRELRDLTDDGRKRLGRSTRLAADVVRLHEAVCSATSDRWYDATDLLSTAAGLATTSAAAESGRLVLYLPQSLTRAEATFGRALADNADFAVVVGLTGVMRADRAVHRSLDRLGLDPLDDPESTRPTATQVLHASDSDDEVRCVVRDVVQTLRTTPAHRIAVLYGRGTPYARLLHEHLAVSGITVNGVGTRAVHERAVARTVLGVLALAGAPDDHHLNRDVRRGDLFRTLAESPTRDVAGDLIPTSRWERISRTANVVAGDDWSRRLDAYIVDQQTIHDRESQVDDPRPGVLDRAQRTIEAATALRAFATALRDTLKQGHTLTTWSELSTWALDLSHRLLDSERQLARLPLEEQSAAAAVEQALTGLTSLDALEQRADLPTLRDVLAVQLEASLPRVGRFGDGVFVAPLSASVGLDVDVVYVVGLAEDIVPGRLHEDALLPEHARDATGGELAAFRDRLDDRHRQLLAALAAGAHRVVASFPRGDLRRSTQRLPSRWLIPTFRELSGDHELPATRWADVGNPAWLVGSESHAGTMQTLDHPASEQEWRVRAASASHPLDDPAVDAGTVMTNARAGHALTRFDGDLTAVNGMPDYARHDIAASPTSLESYVACPHAWFVKRLLRIEPVEQPEELVTISAADIGNLMHEAMDALVRACGDELPTYGGEWTAQQKLRLQKLAAELADDFEQRGLTGHPRLWAHQRIRIMADLAWMLDNDTTWRRGRDARVIASEMAFGMRGHEAVEIPVPGGRVRMAGSADKVDETRSGTLLVTDIKSGSAKRFRVINKDPLAKGGKLQLPVYAHAARQRFGEPTTRAEAVYWFVRRDRGERIEMPLDAVESTYADTLGVIVSSIAGGLFPSRPPGSADYGYVQCAYCNPDDIGYGDLPARWERKRLDPRLTAYVALVEPQPSAEDGDGS